METNGWILSLECAADAFHVQDSSGAKVVLPKRNLDEADLLNKGNRYPQPQRNTKKAKVDKGVLKGRPMLQDIVNDVS
jgi:hypothetical protein